MSEQIVKCRTCGRSQQVASTTERAAWIKYHNAVWPDHVIEEEEPFIWPKEVFIPTAPYRIIRQNLPQAGRDPEEDA
jgi:hypothetical protein